MKQRIIQKLKQETYDFYMYSFFFPPATFDLVNFATQLDKRYRLRELGLNEVSKSGSYCKL